ncbi:hypothetical protein G4177_34985 [Corallococcus sp. ZKHCc1 1396]|uniref:Uncharacterized protein n=1 Tax=Corallococcus soli TaxID=2710757 RepID=A0ABR9PZM9_9BACT|nr:hypothetical protein [Corallococcus soli]MBE4753368.1 hypothetical protein [Corallococcus soli]
MTVPDAKLQPDILPIAEGWEQAKHVLKHLYRREERWDLVVPKLPSGLRKRALDAGCTLIDRVQEGSDERETLCDTCQKLVQADHDAYYGPAYMQSVRTAPLYKRVGVLKDDAQLQALVGDNAVFVVATRASAGRPAQVISAYRIAPPGRPEQWQPAQFLRKAIDRFKDKTSLAKKAGSP